MATSNRIRALNRLPFDFDDGLKVGGVELGGPEGASKVGHDGGTVQDVLDSNYKSVTDFFADTKAWAVGSRINARTGEVWDVVISGEDFTHPISGIKLKVVGPQSTIHAFGYTGDDAIVDYDSFRAALSSTVSTVTIPSGIYTLDNDSDALNRLAFSRTGVTLSFEAGVTIEFNGHRLPLFTWVECNGGGIAGNPTFLYSGPTITAFTAFTYAQYLAQMGVMESSVNTFGGAHELSCVLRRIRANNVVFGDLTIESKTPGDPTKCMHMGIMDAGFDAELKKASGCNTGTVKFNDICFGYLGTRIGDFYHAGWSVDRRQGSYTAAPGHLYYYSGGVESIGPGYVGASYDGGVEVGTQLGNLAPAAIKGCTDVKFDTLISHHREGLVQSFQSNDNIDFDGRLLYDGTLTSSAGAYLNFGSGATKNSRITAEINTPSVTATILSVVSTNADGWNDNKITLDVVASGETTQLVRIYGSNNDLKLRFRPSSAKTSANTPALAEVTQMGGVGTNNDITLDVIGNYAHITHSRVINPNGRSLVRNPKGAFGSPVGVVQDSTASLLYTGVVQVGAGDYNFTYTLPQPGAYEAILMIYGSVGQALCSRKFLLVWRGNAATGLAVASTSFVATGTIWSDIAVPTIDANGVVTQAYTAASGGANGYYALRLSPMLPQIVW